MKQFKDAKVVYAVTTRRPNFNAISKILVDIVNIMDRLK